MALSKEAQELIKDSIRIVREDRFEKYVRDRYDKEYERGKDSSDGKGGSRNAPPPKDEPNDPPKRRSAWWGELDDDES